MLLPLSVVCASAAVATGWNFKPSPVAVDQYSSRVPVTVVPSQSQVFNGNVSGSYWISSFLTGQNRHQYLVISHALINTDVVPGYYRGSIFDITTNSYADFFIPKATDTASTAGNPFKIQSDNFVLGAASTDNVSKLYTAAHFGSNAFNFSFAADHPVLYNMGAGTFPFGSVPTTEWGMPSGRTEGSLTVNGEVIPLDPNHSFTWYDRQWGLGISGNWTWYQLHLPGDVKASIWTWDNPTPKQNIRAATLLYPNGETKVVPIEWTVDYSNSWLSPKSGILYPQNWTLGFPDGEKLQINSVYPDQEIYGESVLNTNSYEGFVDVQGYYEGKRVAAGEAFGLVEMQRFV